MKLYEYNEIIDTLLVTDGEVDAETGLVFDLTLLDRLEMERNEKIENLLLYTAQLSADAEDIAEYAAKLNARAKAKKAKSDRLKEWLCGEVTRYGGKKFETQRIKAALYSAALMPLLSVGLPGDARLPTAPYIGVIPCSARVTI